MRASFVVPGPPKGKERPRVTKHGAYTPTSTVEYENYVRTCYEQQCPDIYFGQQSIKVSAVAYVTPLKKYKKQERLDALANLTHPRSKPDVDNIIKAVLDALNKVAFDDDYYIYELHIVKKFTDEPRLEISIVTEDESDF